MNKNLMATPLVILETFKQSFCRKLFKQLYFFFFFKMFDTT